MSDTPFDSVLGRRDRVPLRHLAGTVAEAVRIVHAAARVEFRLVVAVQLVSGALAAGQLVLASVLAGQVIRDGDGTSLPELVGPLVGLALCTGALGAAGVVQREQHRIIGEEVARRAQGQVLRAASAAELVEFESPEFHNRLQRAQVTAELRPAQLAEGLLTFSSAAITSIGLWAGLVVLSPLLGVLVALSAVPLWLVAARANIAMHRLAYTFTAQDRERLLISDLLVGRDQAAELRAYRMGPALLGRFDRLFGRRVDAMRRLARARLRARLLASLAHLVVVAAALTAAVWLTAAGRLTTVEASTAVLAVALVAYRLGTIADATAELHEGALFLDDYRSFVAAAPPAHRAPRPAEETRELQVRDVTYRYPGSHETAVRDVSLTLRRGEVVALVGENGSGKTTLAKIIAGLYVPATGSVSWNGTELGDEDRAVLLTDVAFLFQNFIRFRFSVQDNVTALDQDPDHRRLRAAIAQVGLADAVDRLPAGVDTPLGPEFHGGHDLSGGQWQRLALARAYYRQGGLVILDEPTAALDPLAERAFFADLRAATAGSAVLVISHRLNYVTAADRIYVMSKGTIVDHGTHDVLTTKSALYADLMADLR